MTQTKVKSKTIIDNTGRTIELPLLLVERNGEVNPLWPLHRYFLANDNRSKSLSWQNKVIQAVGLLLDYLEANFNIVSDPKDVFREFTDAVYAGTIGEDGSDPSGLYWMPKGTKTARPILDALSNFSDWMHKEYGTVQLNPWREATSYEMQLNWAALIHKSNRSFLGHLSDPDKMTEAAKNTRNIRQRRAPSGNYGDTKAFPEDKIFDLLFEGFKVSNTGDLLTDFNWRDIAITALLHGSGLRESEPFHIWTHDVMPHPDDPLMALVRVYHPVDGRAPRDAKGLNHKDLPNREAYLRSQYNLLPRNKMRDKGHAGWKNSKMSDTKQNYMQVYWFHSDWGYFFMQAWKLYMHQLIRKKIFITQHPFLFVSFKEGQCGEMYTMKSYRDSHERAIRKIGLEVGKMLGTTEHGHRHAYGQRLKSAGVKGRIIQEGMHHKSEESHKVYTVPGIAEITKSLAEANQALDNGQRLPMVVDIDAFISQRKTQKYRIRKRRK